MNKKIYLYLIFVLCFACSFVFAEKQNNEISLFLFYKDRCPHCLREKEFLKKIEPKYPELKIFYVNIANKNNYQFLRDEKQRLDIRGSGVPVTIIEDRYFIGFADEGSTGVLIENTIQEILDGKKKPMEKTPFQKLKAFFSEKLT
jgi:glutaredoxin-related protein